MKKTAWGLLSAGIACLVLYLALIFFSKSPASWMIVLLAASLLLNAAAVSLFLTLRTKCKQRGHNNEL